MSDIGSGISSEAVEQNPDIAAIQAKQQAPLSPVSALPATDFVGSLNSLSGLITIQAGTSSPGVTVTVSSDAVSTISIGVIGFGSLATVKCNQAPAPPTAGNDESEGYSAFSCWIDSSIPNVYMCVDASTAAAVWVLLG